MKTTPNIDALFDEGVLFENAISPVPFTLPSHCSMLTGMTPPYHRVMDNSDYILGEEKVTLAEILKGEGFNTAGFVSSFILDSRFGIGQGFDVYVDDFDDAASSTGINERIGGETTDSAIAWLEQNKGEKNFMFLHYYDPHFTYDPPEPFLSKFKNAKRLENVTADILTAFFGRYAGEIAYVDHCIGEVISKLKELGMYDSTMIIVTSDHGEMLGQHGEMSHGYYIYQPAIHVPLVMRIPGESGAVRVKNTVGIIDIVPTVCSVLGIEMDVEVQGRDLSEYFGGDSSLDSDRYLYCQSFESTKYGANSMLGVVGDRYKYIQTTRSELYDLADDPGELQNLLGEQANRGRILQDRLAVMLEDAGKFNDATTGASSDATSDAETLERLESLGYVGGGIEEDFSFFSDKEDPKDLVGYHVRMMEAGYYVYKKMFKEAKEKCKKLIEDRPSYFRPYFALGKIASEEEDYEQTVEYLSKSIELNPEHVQSYQGLAAAYEKLGRTDEVLALCVKILEVRPNHVEAYFKLSTLFYDKGEFDAPLKYQNDDLLQHPSYVEAAVSLGEKLLEKRQFKRGFDQFKHILELDPESVDALNSLAWLCGASVMEGIGNPSEAVRFAEKACELTDYEKPEVLDTLAVAYAAGGNFAKAIETSEKAVALAKSSDNLPLAGRIGKRMEMYKRNQPYRDFSIRE